MLVSPDSRPVASKNFGTLETSFGMTAFPVEATLSVMDCSEAVVGTLIPTRQVPSLLLP